LSDSIVLCDCPGLVFPQFATTTPDLVCDGVLPVDQLREHTGPVALIAKRLPREILEATYGLTIKTLSVDDGGDGTVTPENFLVAYASELRVGSMRINTLILYIVARGFMRSGQGNPDEARAARYILKDYVNGKLLFCHPPPGVAAAHFNQPTYKNTLSRLASKKQAPLTRVVKDSDTYVPYIASVARPGGIRSLKIEQEFFESDHSVRRFLPFIQQNGKEFSRTTLYPHQNLVASDGTLIDPDQARSLSLMKADTSKKHKKMKRVKQRSGKGYDV